VSRQASGSVFESRGKLYARTPIGGGKRHCVHLDMPREQADARAVVLAGIARDVRATKDEATVAMLPKLLDRAAVANADTLKQLLELVERIVAGRIVAAKSVPVTSLTFKALGDRWVSGELATAYPDHVKKKRTSDDDSNLLTKWIYPLVQNVPLRSFTLDHAEQIMKALPPELSGSTRRHVAQTMNRVLKMAMYPLRAITANPLPSGWMPRLGATKKQEMIHTDEHDTYLARSEVPLMSRLFAGPLAREGMRHDEGEQLTWGDLDLKRGLVRLDENKTDDPRSWTLNPSVSRSLAHWYLLRGKPASDQLVFSKNGTTRLRWRPEDYRTELRACGIERPELFAGRTVTKPTGFHGLRGLMITESLARGKSEAWIMDRTGHKSSQMILHYQRRARTFIEAKMAPLGDLDVLLGIAKAPLSGSDSGSADGGAEGENHQNVGGGKEIRTLGTFRYGGFQNRCLRPLGHPSGCEHRAASYSVSAGRAIAARWDGPGHAEATATTGAPLG